MKAKKFSRVDKQTSRQTENSKSTNRKQAGGGYLQNCIEIILLRKYDTKKQEFQKRLNAEDVAEPMG